MERSLILPELLLSIFQYLQDAEDIVNAACVNPVWSRWAVDTIWVTNVVPIKTVLGLLGAYTVLPYREVAQHADEEEAADGQYHQGMKSTYLRLDASAGTISAESIDRYLRRARQLTRLTLQADLLHPHTIAILRHVSSDCEPLFPHLKHVQTTADYGLPFDTMFAVVGSSVVSLEITTNGQRILRDTLTAALDRSSSISDLKIDSHNFISSSHLSRLPKLVKLAWWGDMLQHDTWRDMAISCPLLQTLELHPRTEGRGSLSNGGQIIFPRLENLHLDQITSFVLTSVFPSLRSITLYHYWLNDADFKQMILHTKTGSPYLAQVDVEFRTESISLPTLKLVSCPNMTNLHLSCGGGWDIQDDEMEGLLRELPRLEVLHLKSERDLAPNSAEGVEGISQLTMVTLLSLARHCTNLHDLIININIAADNDDTSRMSRDPPVLAALRTTVLGMRISNIAGGIGAIAECLAKLCPSVEVAAFGVYTSRDVIDDESEEFTKMFWEAKGLM